ncbi:ankyrin repeat protein [Pandoravirus inopinatum]|uniref:Ankyrin repeat protein n=1 Tax=Pandoravirus inopinatum TaxID=1605721 RepID=A0A0B5J0T4_9VIRU|nr:ankyrin repeat protein [Pandoravirus inopinatum]AJF97079.1 ankyrin repeat protein [Pandoravirus inopinatum]
MDQETPIFFCVLHSNATKRGWRKRVDGRHCIIRHSGAQCRHCEGKENQKRESHGMAQHLDLPDEVLVAIFSRLPCVVLRQTVRAVCTHWAAVSGDRAVLVNATNCFDGDRGGLYKRGRWCDAAAGAGHPQCLAYARQRGCPCDAETCAAAASGGRMEMLAHLRNATARGIRACAERRPPRAASSVWITRGVTGAGGTRA